MQTLQSFRLWKACLWTRNVSLFLGVGWLSKLLLGNITDFFFSLISSAWIKVEQLKPYHLHKEEMIKINKGKRFQQAVDAVEEFLRKTKGKDQVSEWDLLYHVHKHKSWYEWWWNVHLFESRLLLAICWGGFRFHFCLFFSPNLKCLFFPNLSSSPSSPVWWGVKRLVTRMEKLKEANWSAYDEFINQS